MQKTLIARVLNPISRMAHRGDVIWVHNRPKYASVLSQALAKSGAQVVLHMHNSHLKALNAKAWNLAHVTPVFCSQFLAKEASGCGVPMRQGFVLHNGVDPRLFNPASKVACGTVDVAFSGRLVPEKGAHVLVEAMRLLGRQGLDAHCTIIGSAGFGQSKTSEYVRDLRASLPANTEMTGYLSGTQYVSRLRQADVFCCPSIWEEPFGMVILEAMASGLPVVASSTGGIPEILQHGGGVLVEPSNPVSLAAKLKLLIVDSQLRSEKRDDAIKSVRKHFTWDLIQQHYTQIADEIAKCSGT
jgi:spore coat protein SA